MGLLHPSGNGEALVEQLALMLSRPLATLGRALLHPPGRQVRRRVRRQCPGKRLVSPLLPPPASRLLVIELLL